MYYAVIEFKGHQYIVREGDTITVDSIDLAEGEKITIQNILLLFDENGKKVTIGTPYITKAQVECVINKHQKGKKIRVIKFKKKNRYQRTIGFRPLQSILNIKKIIVNE